MGLAKNINNKKNQISHGKDLLSASSNRVNLKPLNLFITTMILILVANSIAMILIHAWPSISLSLEIFLSTVMQVAIIFPIIYYLMYKTLEKKNLDLKQSENQLHLASQVFKHTIEGVMITDSDSNIQSINPAFTAITGYSSEEVIGQNPKILRSKKHSQEFYKKMWQSISNSGLWEGEIWNRRKNGEAYPEWLTITAIKDTHGKVSQYIGVFHDITEIKLSQERINYYINHDALTGLPNKELFEDRLSQAFSHANHEKKKLAVLVLNLDRFKKINESFGHTWGDLLLQDVAIRLKSCTQNGDTLSRWSGDEFAFILGNLEKAQEAIKAALNIHKCFNNSFTLRNREIYITSSIGITVYPEDGEDVETLIKNSETAMYRAKEAGRNNYQLYTPKMNNKAFELLELENKLRKALEREEFVIHYQPKVSLKTGLVVGMEALIRWQNNEKGLIPPDEFIPIAEETGLIVPIGQWVLRKACEQNKSWHSAGYPLMCISINLSARQFQEQDFIKTVESALEETGLPPVYLDLEITESIVMTDVKYAIKLLRELSSLGLKLSMDDFGTGYSSLSYLKQFPLNSLKIDQSFIKNISSNSSDATITAAIISMAKKLNLTIVAEGVETSEQLRFLKKHECDEIQGYLFSHPLSVSEFTQLLDEGKRLKNFN